MLGLAQTSSSLVLLRTVRPEEGKGLAQGHGPRTLGYRLSPYTTLLPLRVLGLSQEGWGNSMSHSI